MEYGTVNAIREVDMEDNNVIVIGEEWSRRVREIVGGTFLLRLAALRGRVKII